MNDFDLRSNYVYDIILLEVKQNDKSFNNRKRNMGNVI